MKKREKHGGRTAGTPNKRTQEALEIFGEFDFCPLEKLIEKIQAPGISEELYTSVCVKLLEFKFPKRKAIDHSFTPTELSREELVSETKRILNSIEQEEV